MDLTVDRFYSGWKTLNAQLLDRVRTLSRDVLAVSPSPDAWPIWATVAHLTGMRVYWLCGVLGEPGAASTPFPAADGMGWEDDLDMPRRADELVVAIESSWRIVAACLEHWTPEMLDETFRRDSGGTVELHSRQSVIMRLITHEAYHCGEISLLLGQRGLEPIDLWPPS